MTVEAPDCKDELITHPTADDELVVEGSHLSDGSRTDEAFPSVGDVDEYASKTLSSSSLNDRRERRGSGTTLQPRVSLEMENSDQTGAQQRALTGLEGTTIRARNDMMRANLQGLIG